MDFFFFLNQRMETGVGNFFCYRYPTLANITQTTSLPTLPQTLSFTITPPPSPSTGCHPTWLRDNQQCLPQLCYRGYTELGCMCGGTAQYFTETLKFKSKPFLMRISLTTPILPYLTSPSRPTFLFFSLWAGRNLYKWFFIKSAITQLFQMYSLLRE